MNNNTQAIRLAKFLAQHAGISRRQACRDIEAKLVTVNEITATHSQRVTAEDIVKYNGHKVQVGCFTPIIIAYHKPLGIHCNCLKNDPSSILNIFSNFPRLFPMGRLDKNSTGLLLMTNMGDLSHQIMHSSFMHKKRYVVQVSPAITQKFITAMSKGIELKEGITRECAVLPLNSNSFEITLTQGWYRQIRRMCKKSGYRVDALKRIAINQLLLKDLPENHWFQLSDTEINTLLKNSNVV